MLQFSLLLCRGAALPPRSHPPARQVTKAVITVPAYFTDAQRQATKVGSASPQQSTFWGRPVQGGRAPLRAPRSAPPLRAEAAGGRSKPTAALRCTLGTLFPA